MKNATLIFAVVVALSASRAEAANIIDDTTPGYYNNYNNFDSGVGLTATFQAANPSGFFNNGASMSIATAPNLSAAATQLGGWLNNPPNLTTAGSTWSATPIAIDPYWGSGPAATSAIVYELGGAGIALNNVVVSIGVDNGVALWLDGVFIGGNIAPGDVFAGEHVYNLGNLAAGPHYLQILRVNTESDSAMGWTIGVTADPVVAAVPEPSSFVLFGLVVACGAGCYFYRRRNLAPVIWMPRTRRSSD